MPQNNENTEELYLFAKQMVERDPDFIFIRTCLFEKCGDWELVHEIVEQVRLVYYAKKRKRGLSKMGVACVLLVLGFGLTVINYYANESFTIVMYGFTSAGLLLLFWGLYDMFG